MDGITDVIDMSLGRLRELVMYRSWGWTGKPGVLQSMGLQRVRHDLATEQQEHTPLVGSEDPHPCHQMEYQ